MLRNICLTMLLLVASLPAAAIECLPSSQPTQPILVLGRVSSDIDGIDAGVIERALRDRLQAGGKFRVVLPDQYQYAVKNRQVDKCTTAFSADVEIEMDKSDAGAAFGVRGLVTRSDFIATVRVKLLPDRVTLDEFSLSEKANTFIAGTAAGKAFVRLFDNIALEFESRRDGWAATKMPGLDSPSAGL